MANSLPNETQLYAELKRDNVVVPLETWDSLYSYIGEKLTAINFLVSYYQEKREGIPASELMLVRQYAAGIEAVFQKFIHPEIARVGSDHFKIIRDSDRSVHKNMRILFSHYLGNDLQSINFIVSYYLDLDEPGGLPLEDGVKILDRLRMMMTFLERIRLATSQ